MVYALQQTSRSLKRVASKSPLLVGRCVLFPIFVLQALGVRHGKVLLKEKVLQFISNNSDGLRQQLLIVLSMSRAFGPEAAAVLALLEFLAHTDMEQVLCTISTATPW